MTNQFEFLARQLYATYGKSVDFKNYQGLPMPQFDDLTPAIQNAWCAVAEYSSPPPEPTELEDMLSTARSTLASATYQFADVKKLLPREDPRARYWAVAFTDLEKAWAYVSIYCGHAVDHGIGKIGGL